MVPQLSYLSFYCLVALFKINCGKIDLVMLNSFIVFIFKLKIAKLQHLNLIGLVELFKLNCFTIDFFFFSLIVP